MKKQLIAWAKENPIELIFMVGFIIALFNGLLFIVGIDTTIVPAGYSEVGMIMAFFAFLALVTKNISQKNHTFKKINYHYDHTKERWEQ